MDGDTLWLDNWPAVRQHHLDWWNRQGLVLVIHAGKVPVPARDDSVDPGPALSIYDRYLNVWWRTQANHYGLARRAFLGDTLPIASTDLGPGSLCLFLGCEPGFTRSTVWYAPCIQEPERVKPLRFDPENLWWRATEALLRGTVELAQGRYFAGCPDLIENVDILASLRGSEELMRDFVDQPEWVEEKLWEINDTFFAAYQRVYDIIKHPDGGAAFSAFQLWAPGKVVKVQCDAAAMFSPAMFRRFVTPALTAQCEWLDYSMYHLDGTQAVCHLDNLLAIEPLDAIEWTPQAGLPGGGDPRWYELYRRIRAGGKSVQAINVRPAEVVPLLDAVGPKGLYITTGVETRAEAEALLKAVEPYRK